MYNHHVQNTGHHHQDGKCLCFANGRWCTHDAPGDVRLCGPHLNRAIRVADVQAAQALRAIRIQQTLIALDVEFGDAGWEDVTTAIAARPDPEHILYAAGLRYFYRMGGLLPTQFRAFWIWVAGGQLGPRPAAAAVLPLQPAPPVLGLLARDAQNVHTAPVSAQTNAGMAKLLAVDVPKTQSTEMTMVKIWISLRPGSWNEVLRVANDVNKWFNTKTCRAENDTLYRRVLRGLVATLEVSGDNELRSELYKRLWQECQESVGMCCEGHITRLCNVMVGFDDAFKPPVALGELMQQKMAAIAGLDVDEEEKRRQANAWFDEVAVPQVERLPWLEAF